MLIPSQCYYTVENVDVCFLQPLFRTTVYRQCVESRQEEPKLKGRMKLLILRTNVDGYPSGDNDVE